MKIIAGTAKGRKLKSRKGMDTRPTLANVKESLFSIIQNYIEGCRFLDLFSGTGNIALEALSRGAEKAVMIEKDITFFYNSKLYRRVSFLRSF